MLAAVPCADEFQVWAGFSKHGIVPAPGPWPAPPGGLAPRRDAAPKRDQDIVGKFAQTFELGALGQGTENTRGQSLVPAAHAGQFIGASAPKERGKHAAKDFAAQLLLGSQAAFNLDDEVVGQAELIEGVPEGLDVPLGLALLALLTFLGVETTTMECLGLLFGVSSAWSHGGFLRRV